MIYLQKTREIHLEFWIQCPALLLGVSFLFGIGAALFSLSWILVSFWILYLTALQKWTAIVTIALSYAYTTLLFGSAPHPEERVACSAHFSITNLSPHQTPFQKNLAYVGNLHYLGNTLPCTVFAKTQDYPKASCDYYLTGSLQEIDPYHYSFKAEKWSPIENTWSFAEWRYVCKENLRKFLSEKIQTPKAATLLSSLITGDADERSLRFEFARVGVQHLLAVSGFHFGILIAFLSALLGSFLQRFWKWSFIFIATTTYFIFVGPLPAVQRAWISISLFILSKFLKRPVHPLNILGGALLIELIFNPLSATSLGFHFSFASCFGILFLSSPIQKTLCRLFPKRPVEITATLPLSSQAIYLLSSFFRNALSLNFAITCTILPFCFFHFQKFPLLGIFYNLFFPFLISIALGLLLCSLLLYAIFPALGDILFHGLDCFTKELLNFTTYPPLILDHNLYCKDFSYQIIVVYLVALTMIKLSLKLD